MAKALEGVKILDFTHVQSGPTCTQLLAWFGADVIKVEKSGEGDATRGQLRDIPDADSLYFTMLNHNKRSITVDLQSPQGQALVLELAKQCDVVLQNFKFGGAEKMGLGYAQIKAVKPDIIYCSVSGYDRTGPEAARPGYDLLVQGEAGLMAINGEPTQPPLKFGVAAVDLFTGMYATVAILAALRHAIHFPTATTSSAPSAGAT